jgi:hypothetical protein
VAPLLQTTSRPASTTTSISIDIIPIDVDTLNSTCNLIIVISGLIADVINDETNREYEFAFEDPSVAGQNPTLLPQQSAISIQSSCSVKFVGAMFWFSCLYPTLFIFTTPCPNPDNCVQIGIRALFWRIGDRGGIYIYVSLFGHP